jgi:hypothetical protein
VRNVEGIAIEHGQDIRIAGNTFDGDTTAIHLWWNRVEPSDWGYPKHRDTRSRDYAIEGNMIRNVRTALRIKDTQKVTVAGNTIDADTVTRATGDTTGWSLVTGAEPAAPIEIPSRFRVTPLEGGHTVTGRADVAGGRETIIVDEWGPYDWRSPKLWPVGRSDSTPLRLRVLGPAGAWRMIAREGIRRLSSTRGQTGDTILVTPAAGREHDFRLELEYRGAPATSRFGEEFAARSPVRFGWRRYRPPAGWRVRFVPLDSAAAVPLALDSVRRAFGARAEVAAMDTARLDLMWYRPPRPGIPQNRVLTEAIARVRLAAGRYRIRTIADDAIRVWAGDRLVLDDWVPGESRVREAVVPLPAEVLLRVEHLQLDGWYELRVDIEPVPR